MKVNYPSRGKVSVWVGSFVSESEFDQCVENEVVTRLGLSARIESICEIAFEKGEVSVRQLLEGFSGWETFVDQAQGNASAMSLQSANSALVCYHLECTEAEEKWGRLWFLGSFSGQDVQ